MPPTSQTKPQSSLKLELPVKTVACVFVADLPSWALQRLEPNLRETPVVVLAGRRVAGVCERARKAGIKRGDEVDRVRALCPSAAIAQLEPSALTAAWDAALETMHRVTPWIETVRPGTAYLAGINVLDAEALASELFVRLGLAQSRGTALLAALAARACSARVVSDEAVFLSHLPTYFLRGANIPAHVIERLGLFGLRTLGDLLIRVTPKQLQGQFGKDAAPLWALISGADTRPVPIYTPASSLHASWIFDPPALEPHEWQPILEHLTTVVVDQLEPRVTGTITIMLTTALGESSARQVLKLYTSDRKTLLTAAERLLLEAHPGIELERVNVMLSDLLKPIPFQENLFQNLERPDVREAIKVVHQHYPEKIGRLEIVRPNAPLRASRFRFAPLDGLDPRVKLKTTEATKTKRPRKKP